MSPLFYAPWKNSYSEKVLQIALDIKNLQTVRNTSNKKEKGKNIMPLMAKEASTKACRQAGMQSHYQCLSYAFNANEKINHVLVKTPSLLTFSLPKKSSLCEWQWKT